MASNSLLDKLTPKQRFALGAAVLVIAGIVALVSWLREKPAAPPGPTDANPHVRFGMPADAKTDPANKAAYLITHPQYVLSYNEPKRIANWVCWNLNKNHIGNTKRASGFEPDPLLKGVFDPVKHDDYTGSGFDRGHMCPSKDRSDTEENNEATFFTTNIVPQSPKSNQGAWEQFEGYCRKLTENGSELYIACGPHGRGGTGRDNVLHEEIGRGKKIEVPAACWKVVLVLPNRDAAPTADARTIGLWVPNDQSVPEAWKPYIVSVADVERRTGFKFFPLIPDEVATPIKARVDRGP